MKKIFQFFWFLPRRTYYAYFSPEDQFKKLIEVIKKKHPPFYVDFEVLLRKRFFTIKHPRSMHEFVMPVGGGKEISAYFEVDDIDDGLKSVLLRKVGGQRPLEIYRFEDVYYGPGMR